MRFLPCLIMAAIPVASIVPASAISAQTAATPANVDGRAVATELRDLLNKYYVVEATRPKFDAVISASIKAGRYDVSDPEALVERIQADLRKVTADKHLTIAFDPALSKQLREPQDAGAREREPSKDEIAAAQQVNHGLTELRVLSGNVRFLEARGFRWWIGKPSELAFENAIEFLADGDAIIIDMRGNGGGSVDAVRTLISPFLPVNTKLMTFQLTTEGPSTSVTAATRRGPSLIGKPLYVLTGPGAASAAEEFVGHVQGFKLGELIGETTAGAGFRNAYFPLPDGFYVSISIGQAILASTGKGWEAVGIVPDIATPVDDALDVAHARALKRIAAGAEPKDQRRYEVQAAMLLAAKNPTKTELALEKYAGTYGERTVSVKANSLVIQRKGGGTSPLLAIGPNRFGYVNDPGGTLDFVLEGGRPVKILLTRGDGTTDSSARSD